MAFQQLRPKPLARETYDVLKSKILTCELVPGQRVDVDFVSKKLGVSRTPVTEALQKLSTEGLIQIVPRKGTFVAQATPKDVEDAFQLRMALEAKACELAAPSMDDSKVSALRKLNERLRHDKHPVLSEHLRINQQFHELILKYSNNAMLLKSYLAVQARVQFLQVYFGLENWQKYSPAIVREHEGIVEAMASHNPPAAQRLMNEHIHSAMLRLVAVIEIPKGSRADLGDRKIADGRTLAPALEQYDTPSY
jgi:DNA-binding GntR family transcriptional regulator